MIHRLSDFMWQDSQRRIRGVEDPRHEGSEYESISAFTAFTLNDDMDAAVHGTYLCNEYGLHAYIRQL